MEFSQFSLKEHNLIHFNIIIYSLSLLLRYDVLREKIVDK